MMTNRQTSVPIDPKENSQQQLEQKRSILASDGVGLFQLSFEYHSNFDRNGPDRNALRRRNTIDADTDDDKATSRPLTHIIRRRLVRQSTSVQSEDSAFVDDLCSAENYDTCLPTSFKTGGSSQRIEELLNQMSIESNDSGMSNDTTDSSFISSQLMKLRSASVDSGYLDTASSVSSNVWNEGNDGLTVVEEDLDDHDIDFNDDDEDGLSQTSYKFDMDEEFADSFNEALNRLLKGRREIFHADEVSHQPLSSRTLKRIIDNVIF